MQIVGGVFILAGVALVRLDELGAPGTAERDAAGSGEGEIDGGEPVWVLTDQSSPSRSAQASSVSSE